MGVPPPWLESSLPPDPAPLGDSELEASGSDSDGAPVPPGLSFEGILELWWLGTVGTSASYWIPLLSSATARPGKQAIASTASTDRSEKAGRAELRARRKRVRGMARKVRGISGADKSGCAGPWTGTGRRRFRPRRASHRRPRGLDSLSGAAGAGSRRAGDTGPPFLLGHGIDRRTGAFFCILFSLVRVD